MQGLRRQDDSVRVEAVTTSSCGGSGRGGRGWGVDVFKVFSQNMVLQRFVEQIIDDLDRFNSASRSRTSKRPTSEVWRGSGGAVLLHDHHAHDGSHLESWSLFLRGPPLANLVSCASLRLPFLTNPAQR